MRSSHIHAVLCAHAQVQPVGFTDLRALPVRRSMPFALLLITGTFLAPLSLPCLSLPGAGTFKQKPNIRYFRHHR